MGADTSGITRAPQRSCHGAAAAGWGARCLQRRPPARSVPGQLPGRLCAAQAQGLCPASTPIAIQAPQKFTAGSTLWKGKSEPVARTLLPRCSLIQHPASPLLQSTPKRLLTVNLVMQAHAKGSSLMQPLRPQAAQPSLGALGSAAFAALAAADVAPEADFFQKYQARPNPGCV